jgi:hypothetical protein
MPSKPVRKQWVAARNFTHSGRMYRKGDPVTLGRTINLLSTRGDKWITRAPKPAEPPAEPETQPTDQEAASDGS